MKRIDGRKKNEMRPVRITKNFTRYAEGSVLIEMGNTKVLCNASIEERMPPFLRGKGTGWVTAEYSLLPRSTAQRTSREAARGKQTGRTVEIQRLIGRSLRSVVDMKALGERSITLDCDVLQADGGTRTAAITGAYIALVDAVDSIWDGTGNFPVRDFLAAISVGMNKEETILDLCYEEDSQAVVDMNVVQTGAGSFVEIQGTGEHGTFSRTDMDELLDMAGEAIQELIVKQKEALGTVAEKVGYNSADIH